LGSGSPEFSRYEQFLRQELPVRVRQQLEVRIDQYLNPVEENLKNELVAIVRDMQIQLFDLYKSTQMVGRNNASGKGSSIGMNNISLPMDIGRASSSTSKNEDVSRQFNPSLYIDEELTSFDFLDGVLFDFDGMQQANSIETDSSYDQMSSEGMENELISSDEMLDYEIL
jgi:hypothetical protein